MIGVPEESYRILEPWYVDKYWELSHKDVLALREVIDKAADERPIQQHLAENPRLLANTLSGGHGRWVRPQVRLGSQYVADFCIADGDSSGLSWELVELESPTKAMFKADGELADRARHGIHQIHSRRQWLGENLDYARKEPPSGCGLPDIRPKAWGVVLIDRRANLDDGTAWHRKQIFEDQSISLHTYDWLLDALWARALHQPWPQDAI
jgi:hypothetical protein